MQYIRPTGLPVMWAGRRAGITSFDAPAELVLPVALTVTPEKVNDWAKAVEWLRRWTFGGMREQAGRDINWAILVRSGTLSRWHDAIAAAKSKDGITVNVVGSLEECSVEELASDHCQDMVDGLSEHAQSRLAGLVTVNIPWGMSPYVCLARRVADQVMGPLWFKSRRRRDWMLRPARTVTYRLNEKAIYAGGGWDLGVTMVAPIRHDRGQETVLDYLGDRRSRFPHGEVGRYGTNDIDDPMSLWPVLSGKPDQRLMIKSVDWQGIKDRFQLPDRRSNDGQEGEPIPKDGPVQPEA